MKKFIRVLLVSFLICLNIPFISFASEGVDTAGIGNGWAVLIYYTNDDEYLVNQWKQLWDDWYYFGEDGRSKHDTWAQIDGKWYYFDKKSIMLHDTTTPDGYVVGSDGAWIEGGNEATPSQAE